MKQRIFQKAVLSSAAFFLCLYLNGCSHYSSSLPYGERSFAQLNRLIQTHHFKKIVFETKDYKILGCLREGMPTEIHIYIEGDGLSWISRHEIASDPTPTEPTGLLLAASDVTKATVLYLARPGHYLQDSRLDFEDWTFGRFSSKIVGGYQEILDQLRQRYPRANFTVLGYSGGATIALLLASRRFDIFQVITFAGLLDHEKWTQYHGFTGLGDSLNPISFCATLRNIPQIHFIGSKDKIVPPSVIKNYQSCVISGVSVQFIQVPGASHWEGWEKFWRMHSASWLNKMHFGSQKETFPKKT